ncbi:twin-arginine translocation signal domain-containing protein [Halomicroarcula sp. GCM10025709]|uniref:twin-arginine translocation signal domain-containing protein n=1 Tax=Haloarcula TaxID=2237 RepID=UPI0024C3E14D|nr:twin-arginine translocation signal domain-containing protein [Halomicroarcula sp. YJ-61-S]
MSDEHDRRDFLKVAASGTAASLAGCVSSDGDEESVDSTETALDETPTETTIQTTEESDTATVMAAVQPEQEKLESMQSDITSRVQNGSINQTQAQLEFQRRRAELFAESARSFQQHLSETPMTLEAAKAESGAFLVSGPSDALVTLLTDNRVEALIPAADFESV